MYENENTETADSNHKVKICNIHKYDELTEDLHKYWNKVLSHLGREYQELGKVSKSSDVLDIVQSLNLLEDMRSDEKQIIDNNVFRKELFQTKQQFVCEKQALENKLDQLEDLIKKQKQIEIQNQEMIKHILNKEEENSVKIVGLQKDINRDSDKQNQLQHFWLLSSALPTTRSTNLRSELNSPQQRELRQHSMYNPVLSKIKLTKVQGQHNIKTMSRNIPPFNLSNL